jgi:hypothetical protein
MAVPTFEPKQESKFLTISIYVLALVGVGLLVYFGSDLISALGSLNGKSGISTEILYSNGTAYLDGELLGATPYESAELKPGEKKVRLENDSTFYEATLNFAPKSEVVVKRDLGVSDVFSSGQNFWLEKDNSGTVLSVISDPAGAIVFIDNAELGTTPFSTDTLTIGEYDLRVESTGYEPQMARIKVQEGYELNSSLKLFPMPTPKKVALLEGSTTLYDVYSSEALVTSNAAEWVRAIVYWNTTRGVSIAGAGVNKEKVFDYFVDYMGQIYNAQGVLVTASDGFVLEGTQKGAYLRRVSDGPGLTDAAKTGLESLNITAGKMATILPTGLGYLNVRSEPGVSGDLLTKVDVGTEYSVLEEATGWVKIKVSDTVEGWVSSTYVEVTE